MTGCELLRKLFRRVHTAARRDSGTHPAGVVIETSVCVRYGLQMDALIAKHSEPRMLSALTQCTRHLVPHKISGGEGWSSDPQTNRK